MAQQCQPDTTAAPPSTAAKGTIQHQFVADITSAIVQNLQDQHDWSSVRVQPPGDGQTRPLICGLPPRRLYIHPDDQIAALNQEQRGLISSEQALQVPEPEWVLPIHLTEKWSLADFAMVFDSVPSTQPRGKRILLGILHNDSTVVYYFMHEGMVKPRQN
ncbi:Sen15 protein-domain-containing protein [Stachybotrys elegans]|uniref:Sen15 protein-domain-containing protein n=1 Tax=Stachybotrys elegans TaxID=80388 RepID=A0A8K0SRH5_9HYPO|nr:Sen15 protein-domain-containing protein [Stachybotrys elegans]